jgi:hypothetical protein
MANAQLQLIVTDEELWKLDDRTIRVGRKGLAQARAALARTLKAEHDRAGHQADAA